MLYWRHTSPVLRASSFLWQAKWEAALGDPTRFAEGIQDPELRIDWKHVALLVLIRESKPPGKLFFRLSSIIRLFA